MLTIHEFNKIKQPGTRRCSICGEIKSVELFKKDRRQSGGYSCKCKECHKLQTIERRKKSEVREYYRAYSTSPKIRQYRRELKKKLREGRIPSINGGPVGDGFVYIIQWQNFFKIGRAKNPKARAAAIVGNLPLPGGKLLYVISTNSMLDAELTLHDTYRDSRQNGEWFLLTQDSVNEILDIASIQSDGQKTVITRK